MKKSSRYVCITLDLEPDHAGFVPPSYHAWRREHIEEFLTLLGSYRIPLTVFVVGQSLRDKPDIVRMFVQYGAQFHLHSHTHSFVNPDGEDEILLGKKAFYNYFGTDPVGYRAPAGRISPAGLVRLERSGFFFDASVYPTIWPKPRYFFSPNHPFQPLRGRHIIEVPFTTISSLRLVTSLSWMKLFGWSLYQSLLGHVLLGDIIFGMHLHDLWESPASARLPWQWRLVYRHNRMKGLEILRAFTVLLKERHYTFTTVGDMVNRYRHLW